MVRWRLIGKKAQRPAVTRTNTPGYLIYTFPSSQRYCILVNIIDSPWKGRALGYFSLECFTLTSLRILHFSTSVSDFYHHHLIQNDHVLLRIAEASCQKIIQNLFFTLFYSDLRIIFTIRLKTRGTKISILPPFSRILLQAWNEVAIAKAKRYNLRGDLSYIKQNFLPFF